MHGADPHWKNSRKCLRWARRMVLIACLLAVSSPALAQSSVEQRLADLEAALAAIKAELGVGPDLALRIKAIEDELAELRTAIVTGTVPAAPAAPQPGAPAAVPPASQVGTAAPVLPAAGVQGSPNPLQREDKKFLTGQDLLDETFPNSVPIPGSSVRFALGGYAKFDAIQDLDYVGDRFEFELATIPVKGSPQAAYKGRTTLQAKETRLNFDFRSAARQGTARAFPLQAFLEIDFFEDSETLVRQPRLRHAYGVIGRLLAGQTWTTSGDLEALAGTIDFSGGDALYGDRVAQIRWQDRASRHVTWAVGIEDPKSSIGNPLELGGVDRARMPNFGSRVRWTADQGSHVQLGADVFLLDWQGGESGPSDTAVGFGINLTGRALLGAKRRDALVGGGTTGRGSAHRVVVLEGGGNDAVITENGLDVMSHWQVYTGFSHYWTDSLNSTITTGWAGLDNSPFQPESAIHKAASVHLNLIWFPYTLVSTGGEIMWGKRWNKDGGHGDAWRFQYMAKFKFR